MSSLALSNLQLGSQLASEAICAYNKILQLGFLQLEADLPSAKPYNQSKRKGKYPEKNYYFNHTNYLGISLQGQNATGFSKMYYWHMLNMINKHEKTNKIPLNKGMVCGNLGVSSLAEGDIDGGIAYLAWAMHEDRAWIKGNPENSVFATQLYVQFAEGTNRRGISQFGRPAPWVMLRDSLAKFNTIYNEKVGMSSIFKELEDSPEHRALFEGAIWTIHRNLCLLREENDRGIYKNDNNLFTRLRLFDGIIALCRLIELRMRRHETILKVMNKNDLKQAMGGTLGSLLKKIFGEGWFNTETSRIPRFRTPRAFNGFLKKTLKGKSSRARSLLLLLVIRNYAVHLCDTNVPILFENFENVFDEIVAAYIHYLRFRKII